MTRTQRVLSCQPRKRIDGFDFTWHMRRVCADMVARLPALAHIKLSAVAVSFSQARKRVPHGLQATLTPMRFEGGSLVTHQEGKPYTVERFFDANGVETLYVLSFYLPRFLNHTLDEKIVTITHELWHISPHFNGDLRRHAGRCYIHGPSQKQFDDVARSLANEWLAQNPSEEIVAFLRHDFANLRRHYGPVFGRRIPSPQLVPVRPDPS